MWPKVHGRRKSEERYGAFRAGGPRQVDPLRTRCPPSWLAPFPPGGGGSMGPSTAPVRPQCRFSSFREILFGPPKCPMGPSQRSGARQLGFRLLGSGLTFQEPQGRSCLHKSVPVSRTVVVISDLVVVAAWNFMFLPQLSSVQNESYAHSPQTPVCTDLFWILPFFFSFFSSSFLSTFPGRCLACKRTSPAPRLQE